MQQNHVLLIPFFLRIFRPNDLERQCVNLKKKKSPKGNWRLISPMAKAAFLLFVTILSSEGSKLLNQPSLLYKNTFVIYGVGRRSERDLPVCQDANEACNLVHSRPWLHPIAERLCRCPRRGQCPIDYEEGKPPNSQHVSNRGQFKFCEGLSERMEECSDESPAIRVIRTGGEEGNIRITLNCRCPWPNVYLPDHTTKIDYQTQMPNLTYYYCKELPRCISGETCGHIRKDTYEVYYTCSCPTKNLCVFKMPITTSTDEAKELGLFNFGKETYEAVCTPQ